MPSQLHIPDKLPVNLEKALEATFSTPRRCSLVMPGERPKLWMLRPTRMLHVSKEKATLITKVAKNAAASMRLFVAMFSSCNTFIFHTVGVIFFNAVRETTTLFFVILSYRTEWTGMSGLMFPCSLVGSMSETCLKSAGRPWYSQMRGSKTSAKST